MAAGLICNHCCFFKDVVHENAANPKALGGCINCDLPKKQDGYFSMIPSASWSTVEFVDIHHPEFDGVVAKVFGFTVRNNDIDACHVISLLLLHRKLQIIVEPGNVTIKPVP